MNFLLLIVYFTIFFCIVFFNSFFKSFTELIYRVIPLNTHQLVEGRLPNKNSDYARSGFSYEKLRIKYLLFYEYTFYKYNV